MNSLQSRFGVAYADLCRGLIERDDEVMVCMTAMLAGENALLVGAPGTAKSMLCDAITSMIIGGVSFSYLLTKYTDPSEIFGPVSVQGLKADVFRRKTEGKLPEAHVGNLDEIWKGSSAILNTLLKIMNERTFVNDGQTMKCPLIFLLGASNEYPTEYEGGRELGAMFDRFLFRKSVKPIASDQGRERLLWESRLGPSSSEQFTPDEINTARNEAAAFAFTDEAKDVTKKIIALVNAEGVLPGDRRLRKSMGAARAYAYLSGATQVERSHLAIFSHTLWEVPPEQPGVVAKIVGAQATPELATLNTLILECEEVVSGTNLTSAKSLALAGKKLREIARKLSKISHPKAVQYREHVQGEFQRMMLLSVELDGKDDEE